MTTNESQSKTRLELDKYKRVLNEAPHAPGCIWYCEWLWERLGMRCDCWKSCALARIHEVLK